MKNSRRIGEKLVNILVEETQGYRSFKITKSTFTMFTLFSQHKHIILFCKGVRHRS